MVEPTRRRSQRRRRVDELLELGPAVGLGLDAPGVGMGEAVDGDPVAGLAGGPAQELPGPLGLGGQRPLEQPEGEPARLEVVVAQQAVGDEQERPDGIAPRGAPEPARHGGQQRPANAVVGPRPGRHEVLAGLVLRVGQGREARRAGARRTRPASLASSAELGARAARPRRGGRPRRRPRRSVAALARALGRRPRSSAAAPVDEPIALAELALARLVGGHVDAGRGGQLGRRRGRRPGGLRCR